MGRKRAVVVSGPDGLDEAGLANVPSTLLPEMGNCACTAFCQTLVWKIPGSDSWEGSNAKENAEILLSVPAKSLSVLI